MSEITIREIYEIHSTNREDSFVDTSKKELRLKDIAHASELDKFVVLWSTPFQEVINEKKETTNLHKKIFGKFKKEYKRTVSLVKIKSSNGKTIYREFQGRATSDFTKDMVALTPNSMKLLSHIDDKDKMSPPNWLELSPANWIDWIFYYLNHPDKAIMLSVRMGLFSITLSVISLIVAFIK